VLNSCCFSGHVEVNLIYLKDETGVRNSVEEKLSCGPNEEKKSGCMKTMKDEELR